MSWVRVSPEQHFFLFYGKRVVQVSCIAFYIYVRRSKSFHINVAYQHINIIESVDSISRD